MFLNHENASVQTFKTIVWKSLKSDCAKFYFFYLARIYFSKNLNEVPPPSQRHLKEISYLFFLRFLFYQSGYKHTTSQVLNTTFSQSENLKRDFSGVHCVRHNNTFFKEWEIQLKCGLLLSMSFYLNNKRYYWGLQR